MNRIAKLLLSVAVVASVVTLTSCSSMPDWMPGSGAMPVKLSGAEEVPALSVPGTGSGSFRVASNSTITDSVTTKDVAGTMAHIHRGAKGQNGPIVVPLDKNGDTYTVPAGRKLTPQQMDDLKAGNLYVNVHTNANKGGEVRGQLNP